MNRDAEDRFFGRDPFADTEEPAPELPSIKPDLVPAARGSSPDAARR